MSGRSADIAQELFAVVAQKESIMTLKVVVCDETNVNVGQHGGAIRHLEVLLGRAIQWSICLLHASEIPFRDLFKIVDGVSTGPRSGQGQISRAIDMKSNLLKLPIVQFEPMPGCVKEIQNAAVISYLSYEQKYLYKMCTVFLFRMVRLLKHS